MRGKYKKCICATNRTVPLYLWSFAVFNLQTFDCQVLYSCGLTRIVGIRCDDASKRSLLSRCKPQPLFSQAHHVQNLQCKLSDLMQILVPYLSATWWAHKEPQQLTQSVSPHWDWRFAAFDLIRLLLVWTRAVIRAGGSFQIGAKGRPAGGQPATCLVLHDQ